MTIALDDVDEIVDVMFRTIGRPIRSAALFYTLLYLVDVSGQRAAAFDFKQVREELREGFFWYGLTSVTDELANADVAYFIAGLRVGDVWLAPDQLPPTDLPEARIEELQQVETPGEIIDEHAHEVLFPDDREMAGWASSFLRTTDEFDAAGVTRRSKRRLLEDLEERYDAVSEPLEYVERVRRMFDAMPQTGRNADLIEANAESGWSLGFDGPAWVSICRHLDRVDEFSATAWVDQSWSVEHNNNRWLDRIEIDVEHEAVAVAAESPIDFDPSLPESDLDVLRALNDVLDRARSSEIGPLTDWARHYNGEVGVDLREMRRLLGV